MMADPEETEATPLLQAASSANSSQASGDRQGEGSGHEANLAKYTFYVALIVLFLINAGTAIAVPPTTSVLQDVICERYYARQTGTLLASVSERDCKAEPIQTSLAMVKGLAGMDKSGPPSRCFLLEAAAYSGSVFGYLASSTIMDNSLWTPVCLGLGLIFTSFCLVLPVPEQRPLAAESDQQEVNQPLSTNDAPKSIQRTLRPVMILLKEQSSLVVLLLGLLLRSLGVSVMSLLIIYASQVFNWSFSRSGYLVSLDSTTHLVVLLLLPTVDRLLLSRRGPAEVSTHFALARSSVLLSALGCAGMAVSSSPSLLAISILLYGLGGGYGQSLRYILTVSTPEEHRAITYSVYAIMETLGTLVGSLLWPLVYQIGLNLAGPWVGLPFVTSAGLFGVVFLTLAVGR
ncbi:uncharacterized protein N7482_000878 [Penicillium canariense]|uniref:Major facilitator superfamily (MFS) profile domain-containing protein n=1 Tax=Penicillium canariense TaxID=189055 RepID=A0A9W9IIQ4_9EURO|nr:uncharacterized protein N7482_000878 [Penicillium canariense]KAJ5175001.1 hypothetical protein N7482_000878 [Penicillium canariense]